MASISHTEVIKKKQLMKNEKCFFDQKNKMSQRKQAKFLTFNPGNLCVWERGMGIAGYGFVRGCMCIGVHANGNQRSTTEWLSQSSNHCPPYFSIQGLSRIS